jgi:hypothetical protein
MPNTAEPEPEPVITKKIDGRITEAKCSVCDEELDLGVKVGSAAEQERKMEEALAAHVEEKHSAP